VLNKILVIGGLSITSLYTWPVTRILRIYYSVWLNMGSSGVAVTSLLFP